MGITERQGGDERADRLAAEAIAAGQATAWFDRLYREAAGGRIQVPWDRDAPHPLLVDWLAARPPGAAPRRAVVVGCGLGHDAELLAATGFTVTAFDVAGTGVALARERHPGSVVDYRVADLLALPPAWRGGFDLVVEVFTVQSLPLDRRAHATAAVAALVAPGGTLVVVASSRDADGSPPDGPPWPLTRAELDGFATGGLRPVLVERLPHPDDPRVQRWRAELRRPEQG